MPKNPDFPKKEFEGRYARARKLMAEKNIDALLITERLNYIYFSGHRSQQNPVDKIRPYVFILPLEGTGTLITMPFEMEQVADATWVEDVRPAGLKSRSETIATVLKDLKLDKANIGAELGDEQYLGLSQKEFSALCASLPNAKFVDAAPIILKCRAVKSPAETAYIRRAGEIVASAMAETFDVVRAGMSEIEISRVLRTLLAQRDAEKITFFWCVTSQNGMNPNPTEHKIRPGELLVLDCGVEFHGYASDVSRTASVGEPTKLAAELYNWQTRLTRVTADQLRSGNNPQKLAAVCTEMCKERGLTPAVAGRLGHGVGLDATEYPSLTLTEEIIFEPGMIFACNPNFIHKGIGWINNEDNWLVTSAGAPELLSAPIAPENLYLIRV